MNAARGCGQRETLGTMHAGGGRSRSFFDTGDEAPTSCDGGLCSSKFEQKSHHETITI